MGEYGHRLYQDDLWVDEVMVQYGHNFLTDEPAQFAKLTMGVVQDFKCHLSSTNPMVQHKIYNHTIDLPFANFCAAIRVPQWGSCEKIKERPELMMKLYKEI